MDDATTIQIMMLLREDKVEEALGLFDVEHGNIESVLTAAAFLLTHEHFRHAGSFIQEAIDLIRDDPTATASQKASAHSFAGLYHFHAGQYDRAQTHYIRSLRLRPNDFQTLDNMGDLEMALENFSGAETYYTMVLEQVPMPPTYLSRGMARFKQEDYEGAYKDFDEAMEVISRLEAVPPYEYFFFRGKAQHHLGNLEEAIEDYTSVLQQQPLTNVLIHRGLARYQSGDLEGAIKDYTAAINRNHLYTEALNFRADAYEAQGETALAQKDRQLYASMQKHDHELMI